MLFLYLLIRTYIFPNRWMQKIIYIYLILTQPCIPRIRPVTQNFLLGESDDIRIETIYLKLPKFYDASLVYLKTLSPLWHCSWIVCAFSEEHLLWMLLIWHLACANLYKPCLPTWLQVPQRAVSKYTVSAYLNILVDKW